MSAAIAVPTSTHQKSHEWQNSTVGVLDSALYRMNKLPEQQLLRVPLPPDQPPYAHHEGKYQPGNKGEGYE